jgi:GxxExxY protein
MEARDEREVGLRKPLLLGSEVFEVVGAAMEVHRILGHGFLEAVYQEAMQVELTERGVPHDAQRPLAIRYKNSLLAKGYVADFVCHDQIIVEIKAQDALAPRDQAQIINYLRATGMRVGILVNFGAKQRLEWKRLVR